MKTALGPITADEALWAAYDRCDKNAVTEELLRRYLPELTFIPNASAARDAVRDHFATKLLQTRPRPPRAQEF
jgi:hypothetical protein